MSLIIKNGRVIDPANNLDGIFDILVEDGRIALTGKEIKKTAKSFIDASGLIVMPGGVDMHVHLREPGREDKETVFTGTQSAIKGGFTSVLAMPNTNPAIDSVPMIELSQGIIKKSARARVYIAGAITKARLGRELTDFFRLKQAGIIAVTDDGSSVDDPDVMFEAFKKAAQNKIAVICHCEDKLLSAQGVVNLGIISTRLGLKGISNESEYKRVQRDIQLAEKADCPVHIAHVSCRESVEIIAKAKKKGIKVTAETAPHYFSLTDEAVLGYDTNMKMNPPLRSYDDLSSIRQGLADGTIDVIASDHAPHTENEKDIEFDRAEFGVIGLETELSVSITELMLAGVLDWTGLVNKISVNPARILGISAGSLSEGVPADIVIIDPKKEWIVLKNDFVSTSKNSPFIGRTLKGMVEYTILDGKIVYKHQN